MRTSIGDVTIIVPASRLQSHNEFDFHVVPPLGLAEVVEHAKQAHPELDYSTAFLGGDDLDTLGVFGLNINDTQRLLVWVRKEAQ
jgi:hypothetical protein